MTDFTKLSADDLAKVTTRDGRKVRILCVDSGCIGGPIVGLLDGGPFIWPHDGLLTYGECHSDLILPPKPLPTVEVWVNQYARHPCIHYSLGAAETCKGDSRLALWHITLGESPKIERVE